MISPTSLPGRIAALALPRDRRDEIAGDLYEEHGGGSWMIAQTLRIAARYHGECYRDSDDRLRIAALLAATAGILVIVPLATAQTFGGSSLFTDPITRAVLVMWSAAHLTSAVAAGLLVGRTTLVSRHAGASRAHVTVALVTVLFVVHGARDGSVASGALVLATWIGHLARRAAESGPNPDDTIAAS